MKGIRFAFFLPFAAVVFLLSGCTQEEISYRQLETYNGLSYKYQENDPFSGIVTDYPMNFLGVMTVGSCRLEMEKGMPSGSFDCSNNAGERVASGNTLAGQLDGVLKVWNPSNDQLISQSEYRNGKKDGEFTEFNPVNGQLIKMTNYTNGQLDGEYKEWLSDGDVLTDLVFENGKKTGFQGSYDFGHVHLLVHYLNGERHGEYINYNPDGSINKITNYANGRQHGDVISYNEFGESHVSAKYIEGKQTYEHSVAYNSDGSVYRQVTRVLAGEPDPSNYFQDFVKDGVEERFYRNGDLEFRVNWDKGVVIDAVRVIRTHPDMEFLSEVNGVSKGGHIYKEGPEKHYFNADNYYALIDWSAGDIVKCEIYRDGIKLDDSCNPAMTNIDSNFYPFGYNY
ncbi:toxin-antitoxin system YwqK family antitoxin [Billgrantia montanilacus]|uniref:Toxin-antitoxin system YwqK family antitoxin n=1 Tax=Billgrantia montanilacus TaxID=2282305 RepID=A0A368TQN0_9GAMM|nr:toxin-antitoxin system YwqK family antitoxin [Halomonas montanilacus]RCV86921.1 toxin-antitoxin system YwqK family antitoxin [Halomonas montanilacus]